MAQARPAARKRAPAKKAAAKRAAAKRRPARRRPGNDVIAETSSGLMEPGLATEFPTPLAEGVARRGFWPPMIYWVKVAAAFIIAWILYLATVRILNVLVLLIISFVLGLGLQPSIKALVRRGMKRGWAVAIILTAALLVIAAFLALVIPAIVRETGNLVDKLPGYLASEEGKASWIGKLDEQFDLQQKLQELAPKVPTAALGLVKSFGALIFNFLTVLILTSIIAIRLPSMKRGIARLLRREQRKDFDEILEESIDRVGGYVIGNLATSGIAGAFTFVYALVFGIPYGAALAFGMALFDLIPTIGALIGLVAISLVAFFAKGTIGWALATAVVFAVYQQIENYVIQPRVMKKAIDMSPGAVIIAVMIGGSIAGIVGSLLALPIAAIIKIAVQELFIEERLEAIRRTEPAR
ncbi:MAG: AI-2E family transporter [Actinobacteria bacterium]|nr:AI-2E family transporter [Actinomycetota bacterium]